MVFWVVPPATGQKSIAVHVQLLTDISSHPACMLEGTPGVAHPGPPGLCTHVRGDRCLGLDLNFRKIMKIMKKPPKSAKTRPPDLFRLVLHTHEDLEGADGYLVGAHPASGPALESPQIGWPHRPVGSDTSADRGGGVQV